MDGISLKTTRKKEKKVSELIAPPLWRTDSRPDPSVLSQAERLREFGRLMFRAIERRRSKKS